jgi:hypothetical protein
VAEDETIENARLPMRPPGGDEDDISSLRLLSEA